MNATRKEVAAQAYKRGDKVAILNRTYGGKLILEGYARIVEWDDFDGSHLVHFIGKNGHGFDEHGPVRRFIEDAAQADPEKYIRDNQ